MKRSFVPVAKFLLTLFFIAISFICPFSASADFPEQIFEAIYFNESTIDFPFIFEPQLMYDDKIEVVFYYEDSAFDLYIEREGYQECYQIDTSGSSVFLYPDTKYSFSFDTAIDDISVSYAGDIEIMSEDNDFYPVFYNTVLNTYLDDDYPYSTIQSVIISPLPDSMTETEPNNSFSTANTIYDDFDVYGTIGYSGDVDWFKIQFVNPGKVNFWLGNIPAGCNYDLELYSAGNQLLAASRNTGTNSELISEYTVISYTYYYLRVYSASGYNASSRYLLRAKNYPTATQPNVWTLGSENIGMTSATLVGSFNNNGISNNSYGFYYGTSSNNLNNTKIVGTTSLTALSPFKGTIDNLYANTTYYYQAFAGTRTGTIMSFKTLALPKVATPVANPSSGTYTGARYVTLSCSTSSATIRYTTNGNTPTNNSQIYTNPIYVDENTTIKAKAFRTNYTESDTGTFSYTINYTVTYLGNGNTGGSPPAQQTFNAYVNFSLRANTGNLTKTNYIFGGWNKASNGSGTNYSAGQQVSLPPGNITLYAKWDSTVSYTVSFTPNGGAPAPPAQTIPSGGTVSQPPSMNYSGHTFGGWYTTSNFAGSPYNFSTPVYSSFTLYAKWVPNSVNLGLTPKGLFDVYSANDENLLIVTEPNISNQQRTGTITVTTQDGTDTIYVYQDGLNSQLSVSKTTISATANGKEDSITINSNISWVALSDADWVELDYAIGIGDDELQLIIDRNDELTPRSATITITGEDVYEEITITQAAYQSTADATLSELTASEGNLYPDFRPGAESYSISVPYNINSITITATPNNSSAFVVGAGTKNLVVGVNIFTITVTAQNGTTTKVHTITVDREQDPNAPINIYTLYFGGEDYWIDAYENMDYPVYIEAYVEDDQGTLVTAPELVSLVYTADSGVHNTTGIFTKEDLDISPGEQTNVTATAVLSNGIILQETTVVDAPYIQGRR